MIKAPLIFGLLIFFSNFVWATKSVWEWDGVEKVVAVGDIHGAYEPLLDLLRGTQIVDQDLNWQAGTTHLVSLGDFLDRGPNSRQVMDLLRKLAPQAEMVGGKVHVLLGNHELLNLAADYSDVSSSEIAAFGNADIHHVALSRTGEYGRWLTTLPVTIRIDDTLFMHGGVSSVFRDVTQVNTQFQFQLESLLDIADKLVNTQAIAAHSNLFGLDVQADEQALPEVFVKAVGQPLLGDLGPLWYRGNATCHALLEADRLQSQLKNMGVRRVVVGHTPTATREIMSRFDGAVYTVDTGMLRPIYRGKPRALEIVAGKLKALTPKGPGKIYNHVQMDQSVEQLLRIGKLQAGQGQGQDSVVLHHASRAHKVNFTPDSARNRGRNLAALRLDRMLQLFLVRQAVPRQFDGRTGLVSRQRKLVSERERSFNLPNYCETGSVFDLVAVFDVLIGNTHRTLDNLMYDAVTRSVVLLDHGQAFSTSKGLPKQAAPRRISAALRRGLKALDEPVLVKQLGQLLKKRQIKAILERRDKLLQWPTE